MFFKQLLVNKSELDKARLSRMIAQKKIFETAAQLNGAIYLPVSQMQFKFMITTLCLAMITAGLQAEIIGDASVVIAQRLGAILKISYMATAGFLAQTASLLVFGKLYDLLEPKIVMLVCLALFLSGSIISATSQNFNILIAGQAVAGLGRSGIVVGCVLMLAIIARSKAERALYIALVSGGYGAMLKLAPIIAGLILRRPGKEQWRWIFWVAVPIQTLLLLLVLGFPTLRRKKATWDQLLKFDFIGGALQAIGICTMIMPLLAGRLRGGTPYDSPKLIVLYVITPIIHTVFLYWEYRKPEAERYIPINAILRNRSIPALAVLTINSSLIIAAATFFVPPYLQVMRRSTPLTSALQQLPGVLLGSAASVVVGRLLGTGRPRTYQSLCIIGSLFQIVGGLIWWFTTPDFSWAIFYIDSIIVSIGAGMLFAVGITLILDLVPDELFGQASAFMSAATATGAVVGVAIQGILIQRGLEFMLDPLGGESALKGFQTAAQQTLTNNGINAPRPGMDPLADEVAGIVKDAYHNTQRQASLMFMAAGITSLIASLLLRPHLPVGHSPKHGKTTENSYDASQNSKTVADDKRFESSETKRTSRTTSRMMSPHSKAQIVKAGVIGTLEGPPYESGETHPTEEVLVIEEDIYTTNHSLAPTNATDPPLTRTSSASLLSRIELIVGPSVHEQRPEEEEQHDQLSTITPPRTPMDLAHDAEDGFVEEAQLMVRMDAVLVDSQIGPPPFVFTTREYTLDENSALSPENHSSSGTIGSPKVQELIQKGQFSKNDGSM